MKSTNPNPPDKDKFKGSPTPDKGQAVESGEPTLTGNATDRPKPQAPPKTPKK